MSFPNRIFIGTVTEKKKYFPRYRWISVEAAGEIFKEIVEEIPMRIAKIIPKRVTLKDSKKMHLEGVP